MNANPALSINRYCSASHSGALVEVCNSCIKRIVRISSPKRITRGVFQSNWQLTGGKWPLSNRQDELQSIRFKVAEVYRFSEDLNNLKEALGFHLITSKMIELTCLGYFPKCRKFSQIMMIPEKGGNGTHVMSYRSISLLTLLPKLFKKQLLSKLPQYLDLANLSVGLQDELCGRAG